MYYEKITLHQFLITINIVINILTTINIVKKALQKFTMHIKLFVNASVYGCFNF